MMKTLIKRFIAPDLKRKRHITVLVCALLALVAVAFSLNAEKEHALTAICFPEAYTAYTGYTPAETKELWQNVENRALRYTSFSVEDDGFVTLMVTPAQREYNVQLYSDMLTGWLARCRSQGVDGKYSSDYRQITFTAPDQKTWKSAAGDVRAALAALSCLQFADDKNSPGSDWRIFVSVSFTSPSETQKISYQVP